MPDYCMDCLVLVKTVFMPRCESHEHRLHQDYGQFRPPIALRASDAWREKMQATPGGRNWTMDCPA